ncbi:MAG: 6-carboxytetrahydropterin synthase [Lachnospiraceae bacterium]|nr:6-carboxytetrahydropterin synthase [Lachnospiraceae bacterium]
MSENLYRFYRYKYYLDANHYMRNDDGRSQVHPHTWEITLEVENDGADMIDFSQIEDLIKKVFLPYQNMIINEVKPFDAVNPTTENMGIYFKKQLEGVMLEKNWKLKMLTISENPNRTFVIY